MSLAAAAIPSDGVEPAEPLLAPRPQSLYTSTKLRRFAALSAVACPGGETSDEEEDEPAAVPLRDRGSQPRPARKVGQRPLNAFVLFSMRNRAAIVARCPPASSWGDKAI